MGLIEQILRIALSFLVLFLLARLLGRKEISQMTFPNFVSGIAIGSIAANLALSPNVRIGYGILALIGWSAFTVFFDYIEIHSKKGRKVIEGDPMIVVKNGQVMEDVLRKTRLNINTLNSMLRQKNVFSMTDVEYAIFEVDGKLSVMKKEEKKPVTKSDMNIPKKQIIYPTATAVVTDGTIVHENLSKLNINTDWLQQQLQQAGVQDVSDVFYAEIQQDGSLYIDKRNDVVH
ncbi:DUF421 domain-containing protein [Bacillus sp. MRMR6]|uniref:DUF421 domain-containing protein n=1 Tax=Bacillus sp. MRMR6 TaxID=1928617 RepID=UPI000952D866|nr:DUF421 domain-containing protein [Bacillus sp. MRMR6]OLS38508.1 hypothetical protein BTR25_13885 [Bacillus sp. MRMR6]